MKKARVILSAIAIFTVIGGTLAFKSKGNVFVYTKSGSTCPKVGGNFTLTIVGGILYSGIAFTANGDQGAAVPTSWCTQTVRVIQD